MIAEVVAASLQTRALWLLHILLQWLLARISQWSPWALSGLQDGCGYCCSVLTVLNMLLSTDEFNHPVHFTINSEGDQTASARAAPADAGWVTSAFLQKDCCLDLMAGILIRFLGDLLVTSSRFGLVQNDSVSCASPAFASSVSQYQIPVLRPSASWSCCSELGNPQGWWVVPADQASPCQQSLRICCWVLSLLSPYLFLDVLTTGQAFETDIREAVSQWILMLCCAGESIQCISWVVSIYNHCSF